MADVGAVCSKKRGQGKKGPRRAVILRARTGAAISLYLCLTKLEAKSQWVKQLCWLVEAVEAEVKPANPETL